MTSLSRLLGRQIRKSSDENFQNLHHRLPRYGPVFAAGENQFFSTIKEGVWDHIIEYTPGTKVDITNQYISAVRSIENEVKAFYGDEGILNNMPADNFLFMMVKDSCFFLQLVLYLFGAELQYPLNHPLFGIDRDEKVLRLWMESMFIDGNQIPLIVFEKLINQSFFREVMERTTQWKHPVGQLEKVLYEFLFVPASSNNNQHGTSLIKTCLQGRVLQKPCHLLHGQHLIVLGQEGCTHDENEREVDNDTEKFLSS